MRRCADQADDAVFDVGQEQILLRLVEPVQFVDEDDCRLRPPSRDGEDVAQLGHVRHHGVHADETAARFARDRLGEARLSAAGRAVERSGCQSGSPRRAVAADSPAQDVAAGLRPRPGRSRPHPRRERLVFTMRFGNGRTAATLARRSRAFGIG